MTRFEMAEELRIIKGFTSATSDTGLGLIHALALVVEALVAETTEEAS